MSALEHKADFSPRGVRTRRMWERSTTLWVLGGLLLPVCYPAQGAHASFAPQVREGAGMQATKAWEPFSRLSHARHVRQGSHACVLTTLMLRGGGQVPAVAWSQRQDSLMLKVDIPAGASHEHLTVAGDGNVVEWADDKVSLRLELYASLDKDTIAKIDGGRQITLNAKKATAEWWPKLTAGPKPGNVKVDWASWKDEDEAEDETEKRGGMGFDDGDFDFGSLKGEGDIGADAAANATDEDDMAVDDAADAKEDTADKKWTDMDDGDEVADAAGT